MTTFTLSAKLTADKRLEFENIPIQNQGENQTTTLSINVPTEMASGAEFFAEFYCPHGQKYVSPKLQPTAADDGVVLQYLLPNCVLACEGMVYVQVVARKSDDHSVVFKSKLSSKGAFYVNGSVGATASANQSQDFFANASDFLSNCEQQIAQINQTANAALKPDGVNTLVDITGKINSQYLPAISGGLSYKGTWNASNSSDQTGGTVAKGDYYICQTSGIRTPDGVITTGEFMKNDWAYFNGTDWDKIDNSDTVTSVNGRTGSVYTFAGDYNASNSYKKGETVLYNNKFYLCVANASAGNIANTSFFKPYSAGGSGQGGGTALYAHYMTIYLEQYTEEATQYICARATVISPSATPIETEDQLHEAIGLATVPASGDGYYLEGSMEDISYCETFYVVAVNTHQLDEENECTYLNFRIVAHGEPGGRPPSEHYVSYVANNDSGWAALNICDDVVDLSEVE